MAGIGSPGAFDSLEGLAASMRLPRRYLRELAKSGAIPSLRVGGRLRFDPDAVREALRKLASGESGQGADHAR